MSSQTPNQYLTQKFDSSSAAIQNMNQTMQANRAVNQAIFRQLDQGQAKIQAAIQRLAQKLQARKVASQLYFATIPKILDMPPASPRKGIMSQIKTFFGFQQPSPPKFYSSSSWKLAPSKNQSRMQNQPVDQSQYQSTEEQLSEIAPLLNSKDRKKTQ